EPAVQFADPYFTPEITVRDLLPHRVGFGDPDYVWGTSGLDFATIAHRLRYVPTQTSFRSRFQYNNVTYALAGDVAARAAGTTWQALLHARILGPLGMTETVADASELRTAGITDVTAPHGIVRDTAPGLSALPHALMFSVFDRCIGPAYAGGGQDWSSGMRVMYKRLADSTRAARQVQESKRITGTHPTLPLDRYTGTYADSLFGTATLGMS